MNTKFIPVLLAIWAIPCIVSAQSDGIISGKIVSRADADPIPFVNIRVAGTLAGTSSKLDGSFRITHIRSGKQTLSVSAVGYQSQSVEVTAGNSDQPSLLIQLEEQPAETPEVTVRADAPVSAASSSTISAANFDLRPRTSAQDLLRMVPGLVIAQHAGGGKAEQIFIRGFDCDHGTDINVSVDGVPVNMPSHGHGQGYADLHFVLPEVLNGFEVRKGPYFAQYGDFSTGGSIRFNTLDQAEHSVISFEQGEYGLSRMAGVANLPLNNEQSSAVIAGEVLHNKSYFEHNQKFDRINAYGKYKLMLSQESAIAIWGSFFTSHWDASGQIPERAVASGLIGRFGAIDPSEGGMTDRQTVNVTYTTHSKSSDIFVQSYATRYHFNLFSNFTFFLNDPVHGDEIEQDDDRLIVGGKAELTVRSGLNSSFLSGFALRNDWVHNQLWHAEHQVRLNRSNDANVREHNIAGYLQEDYQLSQMLRVQLALRGDLFLYQLEDLVNAGLPADISGAKTQAVLSPKFNAIFSPLRMLDLYGNIGFGFHSNDARVVLALPQQATLPRALGAEIGARFTPEPNTTIGASFWMLHLDHEFIYAGDDGTTEVRGPTRRLGIDLDGRARLLNWMWLDADITLSNGRFTEEPDSASSIPLAPTITSSGGLTIRSENPFELSLRYRSIGDRPAIEDNSIRAHGYIVFTAGVALRMGDSKVSLIADNLFNTDWNEAQFETTSRLRNEPAPVDELNFTAGNPFTLRVKAEYGF